MLPENAPLEFRERAILWNSVEKIEKARNSQLAREITLALPLELTEMQNINLVREYVKSNFTDEGMCVDFAIHNAKGENPHAHIMLTMRPLEPCGKWGAKSHKEYLLDENGERIKLASGAYKSQKVNTTNWNDKDRAEVWREAWAGAVNKHLELHNHPDRIDHRSFERQGITDQIPTIHLGVSAHQVEQKGIRAERGNINLEIEAANKMLLYLDERIAELQGWLDNEIANIEPPTLADVMGAPNMEQLEKNIKAIHGKRREIQDKLKPIERKIKILNENIKQADIYFEHKAISREHKVLSSTPKKQAHFYEANRRELTLYEAAGRYLADVMNGEKILPTQAWRSELKSLIAERKSLVDEYKSLEGELDKTYKVYRAAYDALQVKRRKEQSTFSRGTER